MIALVALEPRPHREAVLGERDVYGDQVYSVIPLV